MKHRLVCFDLDGTLIDGTLFIWKTIHDHIPSDKEKRLSYMNRFYSREISYEEWAKLDVKLWKEAGATKKDILYAIRSLKLMKGARQTLKELKKKGHKLAVISGSLNIALEKVLPDYREFFDYVLLNKVFFDKRGRIRRIVPTKYDFEHKLTGLKEIIRKQGLKLKDCIFIGDYKNDMHVAEAAGLSISFNSKSKELDKVCDVIIRKKDLREILKFIN